MKEYTSLSDELNKLSKEKKELIEKRTYQLISQINTIKYLQEKLDISEEELMNYIDENNLLINSENPYPTNNE